jgi:toxin-antitoxin system PIN domain toxin
MFLPDINFWLALIFDSHTHHQSAKSWMDSLVGGTCCFCRHTQQGFLRLANSPRALQADAVSMVDAWRLYDMALGDPRIGFSDEPPRLEAVWRSLSQRSDFAPKLWSDAYLAAFAIAGGYQLVTFDRGFKQYANLTATLLP